MIKPAILATLSAAAFCTVNANESFWIGTFTTQAGKGKGIYRSELDESTGKLGPAVLAAVGNDPAFLAFHPDRTHLYAIGSIGISSYDLDPEGGLTMRNIVPSEGKGAYHLAASPDGRFLAVANYWSGSTSLYRLTPEGNIAGIMRTTVHKGNGTNKERQEGPHPSGVYFLNDLILVPDLGLDKILTYRTNNGMVKPADTPFIAMQPGDGPRRLAFHPDGKHVFALTELSNAVEVFSRNEESLSSLSRVSALPKEAPDGSAASEISVHPGGKWVVASIRGDDSLTVFRFDPETSTLTFSSAVKAGVKTPRHFTFSPNGRWVLVAGQESDEIRCLAFDPESGQLKATDARISAPTPTCLLFTPRKP